MKTALLHSPDKRASAWTEGTDQPAPPVFHTKLFVREKFTARQEVVFRSELTGDRKLRDYDVTEIFGTYDAYCVIDWSADNRFLLVEHMRGAQRSDHVGIVTWVYDRSNKTKLKLDTRHLLKEIERYSIQKQYRASLYYLIPIGWESARGSRVIFKGLPSPGEGTDFGTWSVEINGSKPKLIESESVNYKPLRFGKSEKTAS